MIAAFSPCMCALTFALHSSSSERLANRSCSPSPTTNRKIIDLLAINIYDNAGTLFDYTSDHWSCSGCLCTEGISQASRWFLSKGNWHSNCNNRRLVNLNMLCMCFFLIMSAYNLSFLTMKCRMHVRLAA